MPYENKDLLKIQKDYDSGLSWRKIIEKYGIAWPTINKYRKKGLLSSRSKSEANKLYSKNNPRKLTESTKNKISKSRTKYLKNNPDKVPYLLNHYSKGKSFPEEYFDQIFKMENIPLKYHLQVSIYELDFYNEEKKIDVEIDGEQHYVDPRIADSDKRRTIFLESEGWKVYRIRWSEYQKLNFDDKKKIIEEIQKLLK